MSRRPGARRWAGALLSRAVLFRAVLARVVLARAVLAGVVLAGSLPAGSPARAEVAEINVPLGAGGFGFLPLMVMRKHGLVEKRALEAGLTLAVNWANVGGPAAMNDALLSGSAQFVPTGPPGFLTLWDRSRGAVRGVAAISAMPMYLNTRTERLGTIEALAPGDKVAVTSVKVSIPSIVMQMYARTRYGAAETFRFDPMTVSMAHPDAVAALLTGTVAAHFASAPFHQREMRQPGMRTVLNSDDVTGGPTTFTLVATTARFHDANPKAYAAFLAALKDAMAMIAADPHEAAEVLLASLGGATPGGFTVAELEAVLKDPVTRYTVTPERVLAYAHFMHEIGTLKADPAAIGDVFYDDPEVLRGN